MRRAHVSLVLTLLFAPFLCTGLAAEEWDGVSGKPPPDASETTAMDAEVFGPIALLPGPKSIHGSSTTVNFDDAGHYDAVNIRYVDAGLRIERDDGHTVHAYEFARSGHTTSSAPMTACTTRGPGAPWIGRAINLYFEEDILTAGLVFGNDVYPWQRWTIELYDASDTLIGRIGFLGNCNVCADEFLGVTSDVPFRRLRLSHNHVRLAVCVDDVVFSNRVMASP